MIYRKIVSFRRTQPEPRSSFTLIELLVVLAIVAILSVVVILTLNPAELLKQARDSNRLSDLSTLNSALVLFNGDVNAGFMGTSSVIYVSIPDTSSICANLGLPTPPSGWTYACVTATSTKNIDGTGWVPVNFKLISFGNPISSLPVDPINTTSSRNYYTYTTGGSWDLTATLEAAKNKLGGANDKVSTDGGTYPDLYETGSKLTLLPIDYGDSSLVGYWKFEEGTGTVAADSSGHGNNLAWNSGSPTWLASGCVQNACLSVPGDGKYFNHSSNALLSPTGDLSLISWFQPTSNAIGFWLLKNGEYGFQWKGESSVLKVYDAQYHNTAKTTWNLNQWYQVALVINGSTATVYVNGTYDSAFSADARSFISAILAIGGDATLAGQIDDTYFYNRALSAAEIAALYNATK